MCLTVICLFSLGIDLLWILNQKDSIRSLRFEVLALGRVGMEDTRSWVLMFGAFSPNSQGNH